MPLGPFAKEGAYEGVGVMDGTIAFPVGESVWDMVLVGESVPISGVVEGATACVGSVVGAALGLGVGF